MKDKKTISHFLFKNTVVVILLTVVIYYITIFAGNFIFSNFVSLNLNGKEFDIEESYTYPFENIQTESIEALGGWIEILDENKKVIYTKGEKQDDIYQYEGYQLYDYSATLHKDIIKYPFIYNINPVIGPNGNQYLYIIKFPKTLYHVSIIANVTALILHPNYLHIIIFIVVLGVFLLLFFIIMRQYNRFTARHIKTPLNYLMQGIHEMESQNYKFRMSFEAEKEFASIRDTFNKMAERLEEIQVEKRLLELNKQRMIADISHDLKTPITSILGFSKLLNEDENIDNEDKNRYTHYIYQKSSYVAALIDELFEISKLEDENYKFTYIRTDTAEWLRQIISEIYPEIENKDMELDVTISEAPVILDIDVNQMKRVVLNLINNALKYNPKKTVLRIYCNKEAGNAIVRISDNGEGIPKELKDSIFEPFVYKDKSGSNSRSTGLGLAISKRIIERHNGSISLSSNNEDITVFTIVLPLSEI